MKWRKVGVIEPMHKVDRKVDPIEANHINDKMIVVLIHFPRAIDEVPKFLPFVVRWQEYELTAEEKKRVAEHGCWECVHRGYSYSYVHYSYRIVGWMPLEEFEESYKDLV